MEDVFRFITFYVYYGLVLVQFCLLFVPDLQARDHISHLPVVPEEEQPLLDNAPSVNRQETESQRVSIQSCRLNV